MLCATMVKLAFEPEETLKCDHLDELLSRTFFYGTNALFVNILQLIGICFDLVIFSILTLGTMKVGNLLGT